MKWRTAFPIAATLFAGLFHWLQLIPNFTAMTALALFAGARVKDKRVAAVLPILALVIGDIGTFHRFGYPPSWTRYGLFLLIVGLGMLLRNFKNPLAIVGGSLASSVVFFITSNFLVWARGDSATSLYEKSMAGLLACYTAAIPFFQNGLVGDLLFTAVFFGAWSIVCSLEPEAEVSASPADANVGR
jgi:hypothetical protein